MIVSGHTTTVQAAVDIRRSRFGGSFFIFALSTYFVWIAFIFCCTLDWSGAWSEWAEGWVRWDAVWYRSIWESGYGTDSRTLVFPPGFAYLAGGLSSLTSMPFGVASLILNLSAFFAAAILAAELLALEFGISKHLVFLAQLSFPAAFFAFVPYSDAVFYLLFWTALWMDRSRTRWALIGIFLLSPLIRLSGYALVSWVVLRRWWSLLVFVPLAATFYINYRLQGDALYFLKLQSAFVMSDGGLLIGLKTCVVRFLRMPHLNEQERWWLWLETAVMPAVTTVAVVVSSIWLFKRKQYLFVLTVVSVAVLSRNQAFWRSVVRYDWPLSAFLILPYLRAKWWLLPLFGLGFALQIYVAIRFRNNLWAY